VAHGSIDHQAVPTEWGRLASLAQATKMAEIENLVLGDLRREQEINPIERGVAWQAAKTLGDQRRLTPLTLMQRMINSFSTFSHFDKNWFRFHSRKPPAYIGDQRGPGQISGCVGLS
jgi:hypothetical protein